MLPTILLAAAAASALFPAPATYRYAASMGGQPIGVWSVTVKEQDPGTQIDESSSANFAGMQLAANATLLLGANLAPTKYDGSYRAPGQNPTVSVTLTPSAATVSGTLTSQPQQLALVPSTDHFVVIEPGLLAGLFALPAQLASWKEAAVTWITPTAARAQALTVNPSAATSRPAGVPAADSVLSIAQPIAVTIWYDPNTLVPDEISVPSQNAVLTRERS
jgi:hypothetical protein